MMYGYDLAGPGGWWMLGAMGIFAFVVLGSVWLIVGHLASAESRSGAEVVLRERFARGELNGEQFDEAKKHLG